MSVVSNYQRMHAEDLREEEIYDEHRRWWREVTDEATSVERLREIGLLIIERQRELHGCIEPFFWRGRILHELDTLLRWTFIETSARV